MLSLYLLILLIFSILLVLYFSYVIYFFLLPLLLINNNIYKLDFYLCYYIDLYNNTNRNQISNYINTFEINLPFYLTDFVYIYLIILLLCILIIPFTLYFLFIWNRKISFSFEYIQKKTIFIRILLFYFLLNIIVYLHVIPLILIWFFTHYTNFLLFEFDIQFNIQFFLLLYLKLFCLTFFYLFFYINLIRVPYIFVFLFINFIVNISDISILFFIFCFYYLIYIFFLYIESSRLLNLIYFCKCICQWESNT